MPPLMARVRRGLQQPTARRRDSTKGQHETLVLLAAVSVVAAVAWARRVRRRQSLPGPGDDKPAGYEQPTPPSPT